MTISFFSLNSEHFLLDELSTLIVAILPGLIFGNHLLYDSLNFTEQIEATSGYLEMSMKSHRGHRTTLSHSRFDFTTRTAHVHGRAIVKDTEMQRRDAAVRFASSFSRLLTAYILRTMLSEGKRILDSVSPVEIASAGMEMVEEIAPALCTLAAYRYSMRNYIQLLPSTNLPENSASRGAAPLTDQDETRKKETTEGEGDGRRIREALQAGYTLL